MTIAGHRMVKLGRKTFLLIELNAFDASTKKTASQVSSSYITCIAYMMDSEPTFCPAKTCTDPTDVTISVRKWVTAALPAMRRRTSPILIGQRPGFLSNGISWHARNAPKDADWFSMLQIFLITSANALHRCIELFPNYFDVKICFQPSALQPTMPDGPEPPWVLTTAFCIFYKSVLSNLIGWIVSGVSVSDIFWDASFLSGCFNCSWFNVCLVKGKMPFFILSVRILIALLAFPFLISCENLFDISAMFVDVFLDFKLFWIVSWLISMIQDAFLKPSNDL